MADPNLADLAQLTPMGEEQNALVKLLAAKDAGLLANLSDAMRTVLGELGRVNRRVIKLEQNLADTDATRRRLADIVRALENLHSREGYVGGEYGEGGYTGRCAGCRRKWPCKSRRILVVED